ncbi:MAG: OadG family protein [Candidatus Liptonbacteria bacterium]|nr:OadG family protein [Candidatus Liptonbacteria bacterium]
MKKSILWILVFVIVAFGLLYFSGVFNRGVEPTEVTPPAVQTPPAPTVAAPTGDIDEATAAILREVSSDEDMTPVDSDPTLTSQSDATIDGFDQSFNVSQF